MHDIICPIHYSLDTIETCEACYTTLTIDGTQVGWIAYLTRQDVVLLRYIYVEEGERLKGHGSILVLAVLSVAESNNLPVRTSGMTTSGKRLFDALAKRGVINVRDVGSDRFDYEITHGGELEKH